MNPLSSPVAMGWAGEGEVWKHPGNGQKTKKVSKMEAIQHKYKHWACVWQTMN